MKQFMTKAGDRIERFCDKTVLLLGMLIFLALSYYSMRYTEMFMDGTEVMETCIDSVPWNIVALAVCLGGFGILRFLLSRIKPDKVHKAACVIKIVALVYIFTVGVLWVSVGHVEPSADAGVLCQVSGLVYNGEYGTMIPPGYMSYFPHQFGLVFVLEILYALFGGKNYVAFQYLNVLLVILMVYAAYKIIDLLFENDFISIYFTLMAAFNAPIILYTAYVYGDIPATSLGMVVVWNAVKYCKTDSRLAIPGMIVPSVIAGMVRMNSLVIVLAVSIVLLLCGIKRGKPQNFIIVVSMFALILIVNDSIPQMYGKRAGMEVPEGIPYVSWLVMGLQDSEAGPGWYNGFSVAEYGEHDYDYDATEAAHMVLLKTRLQEMWENKGESLDFLRRKVLTQWNAPDYNSFYSVDNFDCEFEELSGSVQNLFTGKLRSFLDKFMDRYQFVLYISTFFFLADSLRRKNPIENHILLIAIIGGMFFSVIWEAMSRYILPYMVCSIPLAAAGIYRMQECGIYIGKRLSIYQRKRKGTYDEADKTTDI